MAGVSKRKQAARGRGDLGQRLRWAPAKRALRRDEFAEQDEDYRARVLPEDAVIVSVDKIVSNAKIGIKKKIIQVNITFKFTKYIKDPITKTPDINTSFGP